jgi:CBS domain containing-hemolysin-like protein
MIAPWIVLAILCVLVSAFYSGSETGIYCLNRIRLRLRAEAGHRPARLLQGLLADEQGVVVSTLMGTNLCNYLATVCVAHLFTSYYSLEVKTEVYTTLTVAPALFVFGEVLPKYLFQRHADRLTLAVAGPLTFSHLVYRAVGLVWVLKRLAAAVVRRLHGPAAAAGELLHPRQEMVSLLREGVGEGLLSEQQSQTLERVLRLEDMRVEDVMIPRARVAGVELAAGRRQFLELIARHHYSRMPVYRVDPQQVVGILNVYDVLQDLDEAPMARWVRPVLRVRPDEPVMKCLFQMQHAHQPMAVVAVGDGRALGIVTMKDLVEELVGELAVW